MEENKVYGKNCVKCGERFEYDNSDTRWYECSTYSEKVVDCKHCKATNVLGYIEDQGLYVNTDRRYY